MNETSLNMNYEPEVIVDMDTLKAIQDIRRLI